jgi:hypothetical protein
VGVAPVAFGPGIVVDGAITAYVRNPTGTTPAADTHLSFLFRIFGAGRPDEARVCYAGVGVAHVLSIQRMMATARIPTIHQTPLPTCPSGEAFISNMPHLSASTPNFDDGSL